MRVLVVAASAVVRAGLDAVLRADQSIEVVGSAAGLHALHESVEALQPDVVLMELERGDDNLAPVLLSSEDVPGPPAFVLLTDDPEGNRAGQALRSGARAVLPRDAQPEEITAAVRAAAAGLVVLHRSTAEALLPLMAAPLRAQIDSPVEALTPREVEVLGMLTEGAGNKQIARRLGISEHTVKFHVGSILAKLGASSRTEAVTLGVRQGLIML